MITAIHYPDPNRAPVVVEMDDGEEFWLRVVGSGAINVRAMVSTDGMLTAPAKGAAVGITLSSSAGGRVTEELWGAKVRLGLELSNSEHKALQRARNLFAQVYAFVHEGQNYPLTDGLVARGILMGVVV